MTHRKRHRPGRALVLSILVSLFACIHAAAQYSALVSGIVLDATGAVIPGADIQIRSPATGLARTTRTDSAGQYRFFDIPPDNYTVVVTFFGFSSTSQTVTASVGQTSNVNFTLTAGTTGTVPVAGTSITSREFLHQGSEETKGVGLYSYILFGAPPNDATRTRYLATLESFLKLPRTSDSTRYTPLKQLNVTYLPVNDNAKESPTELLEVYDYARAAALLAKIPCDAGATSCVRIGGPYIISTTKPLSSQPSLSGHFLYQDLSSIPANVITLWVGEFMNQSAQPDFWNKRRGPQVALKLRTGIELAGQALPAVSESADALRKALQHLIWK